MFIFQLFERRRLPPLELDDSRSLIEEFTALLRLPVQDSLNLSLADDRVSFLADTGVIKDIVDVAESDRGIVEQILALTGSVQAARHSDFLVVDIKHVIAVIEGDCNGSEALRLSRLRSRENDILHAAGTERPGALFTENPANRVGYIALAGAIRSHDAGDSLVKLKFKFICK